MGDIINNFVTDLKKSLTALTDVPGVVLSSHGVAAGTGFMAMGVAKNYLNPMVQQATYALPGSNWLYGIYNGVFQLATFVYGTKVMSP